jgi:protoporphyrinogen oxidase
MTFRMLYGVTGPDRTDRSSGEGSQRWAVVGAGVLGMSLALELGRAGHEVTLIESSGTLGGLAAPWQLGDVTWDRHYHVTLLSDQRTRAMYESIGLASGDIHWVETKTGYYGPDRKLRSVSNAIEFLRLPGLSVIDKLRLGLTIVWGSKVRSGRRMEGLTVERWLRRWSGSAAFDTFWKPLLRAKLGDAYRQASAAFIWATIRRLYAARRSGLKKEMFGYVTGGYAHVCRRFSEALEGAAVRVLVDAPVQRIDREDHGLVVTHRRGTGCFDRVVITTNAALAGAMCPGLLDAERQRLDSVSYVGLVCVSLLLDRPLAPYYLTYITDSETPFTAVVEMTAFVDPSELGGRSLVYLPKYATLDDPLFAAPDDEVVDQFMPYLRMMYPSFSDDQLLAAKVSRVAQVFAVPTIRYSDIAPSVATSVPGLYLAGSANLPFSTLNVDDTLSLVDEVLRRATQRPSASVSSTVDGSEHVA